MLHLTSQREYSSCFTLDFYHVLSNFRILAFLNLTLCFLYDFELATFILQYLISFIPLSFPNTNLYTNRDGLGPYMITQTQTYTNDIVQYISSILSLYFPNTQLFLNRKTWPECKERRMKILSSPLALRDYGCSVTQLCLTLCELVDCRMLGFPVIHHLPELAQIHVL